MSLHYKTCQTGKVRRRAYRVHTKSSRQSIVPEKPLYSFQDFPQAVKESISFSSVDSTIFKNIHIPPEALNQKLPVYSTKDEKNLQVKSAIAENSSINSIRGRRRKIPFYEVVASAKEFLTKREAKKKKENPFVLNDLQAALPSVEKEGREKSYKISRASKRFAQQNAEMRNDLQAYYQCLRRPDFVADPFGGVASIVAQHILKD